MLKVSFQGERGAFSEAAAISFFDNSIEPIPCRSFGAVFANVEGGKTERGIIPIENSLAGSIHQNYKLLMEHSLQIDGEQIYRVHHSLIGHPGIVLGDICKVISHPQALAQCEKYLTNLGIETESVYDTAGAVKLIKDGKHADWAAIASNRAADVYGMQVLAENIEDDDANFTRFLILSNETKRFEGISKTSIVFGLRNEPGALFKALKIFAGHNLDLTKIESYPIPGHPWEYWFYLDFIGNTSEGPGLESIEQLRTVSAFLKVLGSYKRDVLQENNT
jgi:prephenate dehydratase